MNLSLGNLYEHRCRVDIDDRSPGPKSVQFETRTRSQCPRNATETQTQTVAEACPWPCWQSPASPCSPSPPRWAATRAWYQRMQVSNGSGSRENIYSIFIGFIPSENPGKCVYRGDTLELGVNNGISPCQRLTCNKDGSILIEGWVSVLAMIPSPMGTGRNLEPTYI